MKSDIVDISVQLHHETEKAVLVSDNGNKDKAIWIPKSLIEISQADKNGIVEISLPEWMAKSKGLI